MKWFGQMLTSLAMIDSSLTREDALQVPAAHRSDSNCSSVPVPTPAVWFGHNRWTENFPNEKSPSSSSSSSAPLASGLHGTGRLFYARVSCYQVVTLGWLGEQSFWETVKCILESFQLLLHICCCWVFNYFKIIFSWWTREFHLKSCCLPRNHGTCYPLAEKQLSPCCLNFHGYFHALSGQR